MVEKRKRLRRATTTKGERLSYTLFDTAIGRCGIAWSERGMVRIQFPEATEAKAVRRLAMDDDLEPAKPPPRIARAVDQLRRHLGGDLQDFGDLALDTGGLAPFYRRVYEGARRVPAGRTISYGELAKRIDAPGAARAVGQALGKNPFAIVVPCHRILAANGKVGGFSAYGGVGTKQRILAIEGVALGGRDGAERGGVLEARRAVEHLVRVEPRLSPVVERVGPFRLDIRKTHDAFTALAEAIVYQQLTGKAAATIFARLLALYPGRGLPKPKQVLATPDATLRQVGLSAAKTRALKDLADKVLSGVVPDVAALRRMSDEEILERLTQVRGVGRWTAQMLLIFRLGRHDVLPTDDYGVRKGFAVVFRKRSLPSPKALARYGARWRPYRTVASWYLWRALELSRSPA